ncbi:squalene/phytoene synthase family protein [Actinacidiphila glaucinigra]|uniref:squalene/phytoene synthase family protein n=1 Tax=Actinacidiphila glaucinigra TaxID=235986 RepID=UPI0036E054A0
MTRWRKTLDRAGITDPALREAYTAQRRLVAGFDRASYAAVRLLLPAPVVPDALAATAFMHHGDNLLDRGPDGRRAFAEWEGQVRAALAGAPADPLTRALAHTVTRRPVLRAIVADYLVAAPADAQWRGFATEADFQAYVDAYSLPAFLLVAGLLAPPAGFDAYRAACRTFIEAAQRLDFLEDMAEDLADGRLGVTEDALARHGLSRTAMEQDPDPGSVAALVGDQAGLVRAGLAGARELVDLVPEPNRPMVRALVTLQGHRLRSAERAGATLARRPAPRPLGPALLTLLRAYAGTFRHRARS